MTYFATRTEAERAAVSLAERHGLPASVAHLPTGEPGAPTWSASPWLRPDDPRVVFTAQPSQPHTCRTCRPDLYRRDTVVTPTP